jgi:hypothetical protein
MQRLCGLCGQLLRWSAAPLKEINPGGRERRRDEFASAHSDPPLIPGESIALLVEQELGLTFRLFYVRSFVRN